MFSLHGLLPALWLHPLDAAAGGAAGAAVRRRAAADAGPGLDALGRAGGAARCARWLLTDAALIVVYLGLLAAFADRARPGRRRRRRAVRSASGMRWHARRWTAALRRIGELVEKTLQILINTLSFARVGAFALAHAGLSSAIVALMDAADSLLAKALVLVLGNAVVIVLEAMVVSIQTTRLVLFEFFTRFMQGRGRAFRPLPAPPFSYQEN